MTVAGGKSKLSRGFSAGLRRFVGFVSRCRHRGVDEDLLFESFLLGSLLLLLVKVTTTASWVGALLLIYLPSGLTYGWAFLLDQIAGPQSELRLCSVWVK